MKTRTIKIKPDAIRIDGSAWGAEPLELVFEEYNNGERTRRARVRMRPIDIQDLATRLWEIHRSYETEVNAIAHALRGPK